TPQQLINLNGHIDWSIMLDAWGNALSEENPHQLYQPIRMQGQQYDEESGLHYNRHRYYDPTIGRYITQDPIGLRGGVSFYSYPVNPLQSIDPLGLKFSVTGDRTDFDTAITYLKKDSGMAEMINDIDKYKYSLGVDYYTTNNNGNNFNSTVMKIHWNPHTALLCSNGKKQSPALGLGHEIAHAHEYMFGNVDNYNKRRNSEMNNYDNKEEYRVIMGPENTAAKNLGEGIRKDHFGTGYSVLTPLSR
ncbi:RHS repeat-associated core domain-containing protein, partial [Hafnia alvei]